MMRERKIAGREQRPNRIFGCSWGEWRAIVVAPFALYFLKAPWLFIAIMLPIWWSGVLTISRRYPPGAMNDVVRHWTQMLRFGGLDFSPTRTDTTLRNGDPYLPNRRKRR